LNIAQLFDGAFVDDSAHARHRQSNMLVGIRFQLVFEFCQVSPSRS
jgi:hypothetical protein